MNRSACLISAGLLSLALVAASQAQSINLVVGTNTYTNFRADLTNGTWVYVDADPLAGSPVRATQRSLGYREVDYKDEVPATLFFSAVTPTNNAGTVIYDYTAQANKTNLVGFWVSKDVPMMIGPDGLAYITDGHHTTAGYLSPVSPVRQIIPGMNRVILGHIVANYFNPAVGSQPPTDAWWQARAAENNALLYGPDGDQLGLPGEPNYDRLRPILPSVLPMPTTPSTLATNGVLAMTPSLYRGLTWGLADAILMSATDGAGKKVAGFKKAAPGSTVDINFVEFYWSDYLRNRIVWDDSKTGSPYGSTNGDASVIAAPLSFFAAVANGTALARSEVYLDQHGRNLTNYTNATLFSGNTVNWANASLSNGLAAATDTYHLYLLDDSSIAGTIDPSARSTNILHINTTVGMTVSNSLLSLRQLLINDGPKLQTSWKDVTVSNSTLRIPAGTGAVTLPGAVTVADTTIVNNGTLVVSGTLGSNLLTVAGGTLTGTGTITGAVNVLPAGTLAPGAPLGKLTIAGPLTLAGATLMEINKTGSTRASDSLAGITTLTYGGSLKALSSGTALQAGDTFSLFNATVYRGFFSALNLPSLSDGLFWNTASLLANGSISVTTNPPPVANDDALNTMQGHAVIMPVTTLLANDSDPNSKPFQFAAFSPASANGGSVVLTNGNLVYTPAAGFAGTDLFTYQITNALAARTVGRVLVSVGNLAPSTGLTGPTNATLSAPAQVVLTATGADEDDRVTKLEIFEGATKLGSSAVSPYVLTLSNVATGTHSYFAVVTDTHGATNSSSPVSVIVTTNNLAPAVTLSAPASGSSLVAPANFSLPTTANDPDGYLAKVDFYRNNAKISTLVNAPWNLALSNQPIGSLSFYAVATDNQGATATSAVVSITVAKAASATPLTLQLLHASDLEAGVPALEDAPRFSSVLAALRSQYPTNTVVLSSGDNFIPGPFYNAAGDAAAGFNGVAGRADIALLNALGFHAAAFGNHEFDNGTPQLRSLLLADAAVGYGGTLFPYLSANLDFSTDSSLASLAAADGQPWNLLSNKVAKTAIIPVAGQNIGVVGVTTPDLRAISSPGTVGVSTNIVGATQAAIDSLLAQGVNKIVVLAHLQQYANEFNLAAQLRDADVVIAGGSHAVFAKPTDRLRPENTRAADYPVAITSATGEPVYVVNTDGNYRYVGRLVLQFDTNGVVSAIDPVSGAYATDAQGVKDTGNFAANPAALTVVSNLAGIINAKDGLTFGRTLYYLNGLRGAVRTEESNLGDLTADANLWFGRQFDTNVCLSLKNGGGIRDSIGAVLGYGGGAAYAPPQANPAVGKVAGEISQLDIENALRFNNGLSLLTLTAQQLRDAMEWSVAAVAPGATPGQFPQVSGMAFSFNPTNAPMTYTRNANNVITGIANAGRRLRSLAVATSDGQRDLVVENGVLVGNPSRTFRMITLDYLAGGGDNYYVLSQASNRLDLVAAGITNKTFATPGGEQKALADYLKTIQVYSKPDTSAELDDRIQNLSLRPDAVVVPLIARISPRQAGVEISFVTFPGKLYTLQVRGSLSEPWVTLPLSAIGNGASMSLVDSAPGSWMRFYRVLRTD